MRPDIANADGIDIEILPGTGWAKVAHIHPLVYPPDEPRNREWAAIEWTDAEHCFVLSNNGVPASHVALHIRDGIAKGARSLIAGIGGVMTHPQQQMRGFARRLLALAHDRAVAEGADFGLLVCEDYNVPFYAAQGWRLFRGRTICRQRGTDVDWTLSPVMVRDVCRSAPDDGTVDLRGLPW